MVYNHQLYCKTINMRAKSNFKFKLGSHKLIYLDLPTNIHTQVPFWE
jgi:hypothetical protein